MSLSRVSSAPRPVPPPGLVIRVTAAFFLAVLAAGCGGSPSSGPVAGQFTTVAIQLSSAANSQLTQFVMGIQSITLTNRAGVATIIFNTPATADFIPINGAAYPLATVLVPQDVYTSAAVSFTTPWFIYSYSDSTRGIVIDHGLYSKTPGPAVVSLSEPISVEGSAMGLTLSLDVSKSLTLTNPTGGSSASYTGTPTFDLTAFPLTAKSTTPLNGKCIGLGGQISAINTATGSLTVTLTGNGTIGPSSTQPYGAYATGAQFTASLTSATQFQGISSASALAAGTFINFDLALEPDGSYTASRIEVQDATTTNVTAGPVLESNPQNNYLYSQTTQFQGSQLEASYDGPPYSFVYAGSTKFQTSARFPNLTALPFTPNFSAATAAAGQLTSIGALSYPTMGGSFAMPTTVTLLPQIVDAVITAVSTSGSYTVYTVQLAPLDLIVQMNQPNPATTDLYVPNPNIVHVYVDSTVSLINTAPLAVGGIFRFNGLLFDDAGALRMVAGQINDGVPQ